MRRQQASGPSVQLVAAAAGATTELHPATTPEDAQTYLSDPKAYDKWKTLVPYIYDFFTNHHTSWPSLSCRWGSIEKREKYKKRKCPLNTLDKMQAQRT